MKRLNQFKYVSLAILGFTVNLFYSTNTFSQSVITKRTVRDHRNPNNSASYHRIVELKGLRPDKHTKAVREQLGIMGNDFFETQYLANHKNTNGADGSTASDYWTVEGTKRTFCGKLIQKDWHEPERFLGIEGSDDDLNIQIVCNPKNPDFGSNYKKIKDRSRNIYTWTMIEGEIDIDNNFKKFYDPKTSNLKYIQPLKTDVCLYGPWIEEVYDPDEDFNPNKDHVDVHEIHPSEQFWWTEKTPDGFRYYLNAANDASGKFGGTGWSSDKSKNIFAIAFDINRKVTKKVILSAVPVCNQNSTAPMPDGIKHYLVYGQDTLIEVRVAENAAKELVTVSFEEVGIDPYLPWTDSIIKGFVVFQSNIDNSSGLHGNLMLVVDKKKVKRIYNTTINSNATAILQVAQIGPVTNKRVKVSLKEITTLENAFETVYGPKPFKLVGYIFAETGNDNTSFSISSDRILDGKAQLLFPISPDIVNNRVIRHYIGGNGSGTLTLEYSNSVFLSLAPGEKINILTDFEASHESDYIRTLELVHGLPFHELRVGIDELKKNVPFTKEIVLENWERKPDAAPKKYKMKIKIEFLLLD